MFRTACIILVLALALPTQSSAAGTDKTTAGNLQKPTGILFFRPTTFVCAQSVPPLDPASGKALLNTTPRAGTSESPGPQPRPIPPGKQLKDLCPPGTAAYALLPHISHELLPPPFGPNIPRPSSRPDPGGKNPAPSADTGTTAAHP